MEFINNDVGSSASQNAERSTTATSREEFLKKLYFHKRLLMLFVLGLTPLMIPSCSYSSGTGGTRPITISTAPLQIFVSVACAVMLCIVFFRMATQNSKYRVVGILKVLPVAINPLFLLIQPFITYSIFGVTGSTDPQRFLEISLSNPLFLSLALNAVFTHPVSALTGVAECFECRVHDQVFAELKQPIAAKWRSQYNLVISSLIAETASVLVLIPSAFVWLPAFRDGVEGVGNVAFGIAFFAIVLAVLFRAVVSIRYFVLIMKSAGAAFVKPKPLPQITLASLNDDKPDSNNAGKLTATEQAQQELAKLFKK